MRHWVFSRDLWRCAYCGRVGDTLDHVVPKSQGGEDLPSNLVVCCEPCNRRKAAKLLAVVDTPYTTSMALRYTNNLAVKRQRVLGFWESLRLVLSRVDSL